MKEELRNKYKIIRNNVLDKELKSKIIIDKVINTNEYKKSKVIGIYNSFSSEVNTKELINVSLKEKIVCLPKVINNEMVFYQIDENTKYEKNSYGILEPITDNIIPKESIDLMIVPGICFDKYNNRIGFGRGYYDRYLMNTNIYKIGICFSEQIYEGEISSSEFDIKMDKVITE